MKPLTLYGIITTLTIVLSTSYGQIQKDDYSAPCESCHKATAKEMVQSVHGIPYLTSKGVSIEEADKITNCLTCHNKHGKDDPEASNLPLQKGKDVKLCGNCHLQEQAFYFDSYHGRHFSLNKVNIPTCTYCHVGHEIPLNNPRSFLYPENVGKICAGCHGGSEQGKIVMATNLSTPFTGGTLYGQDVYKLALSIKIFYTGLTLLFFGFAITCGLELLKGRTQESPGHFISESRISLRPQLFLLIIIYFFLDTSGTELLYSHDSGTVIASFMSKISQLTMKIYGSADTRSLIHRVAALALLLLFIFHLIYLMTHRHILKDLRLRLTDLKIAIQEFALKMENYSSENYLWKRKFVYWFIFLLVFMMILTGVIQWYAFSILKISQLQLIRYARLIHDWNGLLLSMNIYGIIILYFGILYPLAKRRIR